MQSADLEALLTALAEETKAKKEQTEAINNLAEAVNNLVESNTEVVDLLLGELGPEAATSEPKYLGSR